MVTFASPPASTWKPGKLCIVYIWYVLPIVENSYLNPNPYNPYLLPWYHHAHDKMYSLCLSNSHATLITLHAQINPCRTVLCDMNHCAIILVFCKHLCIFGPQGAIQMWRHIKNKRCNKEYTHYALFKIKIMDSTIFTN